MFFSFRILSICALFVEENRCVKALTYGIMSAGIPNATFYNQEEKKHHFRKKIW